MFPHSVLVSINYILIDIAAALRYMLQFTAEDF